MTDTDGAQRNQYQASVGDVQVREGEDDGDGLFRVRMPVSSTAEARDGDAFTRDRLAGFRDQIDAGDISVFLDHGRNATTGSRYSALGKVGYWDAAEVADRGDGAELVAEAVLMDPAELDAEADTLRDLLATLKAQAEAGVPLASSVGWSEDTGDRDVPGGADLLEISIVGIPSDPRTTTASAEPEAMARAVSAASSDFDVATFVRELNKTDGRAEYEVGDETVDITPPDAMQAAATVALAMDDELDTDCGTGVGSRRARQIAGDEVGPDVVDEVAAYLTSHEEDVTADGTPSEWSDEEWADCGNLQYAKWGGLGTGTGLEWAQRKANEVADAKGEELPYSERAHGRNLDDPAFAEGDAVMWSSNDTPVHGRVADVGAEFTPAEGVTITGDDGEAVYLIHEFDDSLEPPQYRRENVAKPESSLDESGMDLPPTDGNFAESSNMTDDDTEPDGESGADSDDEQARMDAEEFRESMLEMQQEQTDILREMREGDMDDDEDDEDGGDMDENAADPNRADADADADVGDEERTVVIDGEDLSVSDASDRLADLQAEADDAEPEDLEPQTTDRVADEDSDDTDSDQSGFGMAARMDH